MHFEGSIVWLLSLVLMPDITNLVILLCTTGVAYIFQKKRPRFSVPVVRFRPDKVAFAVLVGKTSMLLVLALCLSYRLKWSFFPSSQDMLRLLYAMTPGSYGFVALSTVEILGYILCVYITKITISLDWGDLGFIKPRVSNRLVILLIVFGYAIMHTSSLLVFYATGTSSKSYLEMKEILMSGNFDFLLVILFALILPIIEEIFFRGVLCSMCCEIFGSKFGLLVQGIAFAFAHGSVADIGARVLAGLVLGYTYQRSKSISIPIVIHLLNNDLAYLYIFLTTS